MKRAQRRAVVELGRLHKVAERGADARPESSGIAGARRELAGSDPDGEQSSRAPYGSGFGLAGFPVIVAAVFTTVIAWHAGGNATLLVVSSLVIVVLSIAAGIARAKGMRLSPPMTMALLLVGIAGISAWSVAFRGLDGGLWVALLILCVISGMVLSRSYAVAVGIAAGAGVVAVGVFSEQIDKAHLPTLIVGASSAILTTLVASAYQEATVRHIRSQSEASLLAVEDANLQLTAVIQGLTEGLVTTDDENLVNRWNSALERLTGRPEAEVLGRPIDEALELTAGPKTLRGREHPCIRARSGSRVEGGPVDSEREVFLVTADGRRVPVTVSAAPLTSERKVAGVAAVVIDVSRERDLNEARDALISMVSHELRTPLTMILGFAELLIEGGLSRADQTHCAAQIDEAAHRLNQLIEDLLSAAAIESGQVELNMQEVALHGVVGEVISAVVPEQRARIRSQVPRDLTAYADPDKLAQVLANLIGNALKYSDLDDAVTLAASRSGKAVRVTVADSGIGIDPADAKRLFEKFARAGDARVQAEQGTGLGLYISRQIVELHGGRIDVESTPGVGSEFRFTIPAEPADEFAT